MIENIALDGNKTQQESLDHYWGNFLAGVWLNRCNRIRIRNVTSRESCADGVSWQTSDDVSVEDCHCHDNVGFGLHAGGGTQRPLARRNTPERNYIGFYFCWGVRYGLVENNRISDSQNYGIRLGQKDTDNSICGNEVRRSGVAGVVFEEVGGDRAYSPDRNRLVDNHIVDSGPENGIGVDVQGIADAIAISRNDIRETRQPLKRIGVRIGAHAANVQLVENQIEGLAVNISDLRRPSA
jgi:nitrous oxidase accessory protein NosD